MANQYLILLFLLRMMQSRTKLEHLLKAALEYLYALNLMRYQEKSSS